MWLIAAAACWRKPYHKWTYRSELKQNFLPKSKMITITALHLSYGLLSMGVMECSHLCLSIPFKSPVSSEWKVVNFRFGGNITAIFRPLEILNWCQLGGYAYGQHLLLKYKQWVLILKFIHINAVQ